MTDGESQRVAEYDEFVECFAYELGSERSKRDDCESLVSVGVDITMAVDDLYVEPDVEDIIQAMVNTLKAFNVDLFEASDHRLAGAIPRYNRTLERNEDYVEFVTRDSGDDE